MTPKKANDPLHDADSAAELLALIRTTVAHDRYVNAKGFYSPNERDTMRTPLFEKIVVESTLPVVIYGKPEADEYTLVFVRDGGDEFKKTALTAVYAGFRMLGVVGLLDGAPASALEVPGTVDDPTIAALSRAYVQILAEEIMSRMKPKDDFAAFMDGLYRAKPHDA